MDGYIVLVVVADLPSKLLFLVLKTGALIFILSYTSYLGFCVTGFPVGLPGLKFDFGDVTYKGTSIVPNELDLCLNIGALCLTAVY